MQVIDGNGRLKVEVTNFIEEVTIGVTTITGGVSGRALYDNAGVLGELDLASIYVPLSRTLTINGTTQDLSADRTFTISTGITIGTTAITSGTVGRVLFEGTGNVVQESANLFWDNTNGRLGIGTASPTQALNVSGFSVLSTSKTTATPILAVTNTTSSNPNSNNFDCFAPNMPNGGVLGVFYGGKNINSRNNFGFNWNHVSDGSTGNSVSFEMVNVANIIRAWATGNVGLNTGTDAGFKLDVNGTARVSGQATIAGTTNASAGIGRNTLINGTITATANSQTLVGLDIEPTFNTGAFTGVEGLALRVTGFVSNFTSSGATQIRIIGPSGSNKSLFFFNSSTTFASTRIYNQGTNNNFVIATGDSLSNPTDRFTIFASTGNVAINTATDAGFKLDVNGTARFGNISQATNANSITAGYEGGFVLTGGVGSLKRDTTTYNKTLLDCGYEGGLRIRPYSVGFTSYVDVRSDTSSALTVTSTNQGFLPPRMTTTQKNAIATPASGLMVYDTTLNVITYYNGTTWI